MHKIRVLHVILSFGMGGAERLVVDIEKYIDKNKYMVTLVSLFPKQGTPLEKELENKDLSVYYLGLKKNSPFSYFKALYDLMCVFKNVNPHIIHTHLKVIPFTFFPTILYKVPGRVHTLHSIANREADGIVRFINRIAFRFFKVRTVCVSAAVKKSFEDLYGKSRQTIVIYNGIPINKFLNVDHKKKGNKKILINVARFTPQKNHRLLIEVFHILNQKTKDVELWLIGDGPLRNEIEILVREKCLEEKVKFLGVREDIPEILAMGDVFVSSSIIEGHPVSLLEALAAGLPIVATAVGGVSEALDKGKVGILVKPGDREMFSNMLFKTLVENNHSLIENGKKFVAKNFDIKMTVQSYEKLYLTFLQNHKHDLI